MTADTVAAPDIAPALDPHYRMKDIPAGLSEGERLAYLKSYGRALQTHIRKHGAPAMTGPVPAAGTAARRMFARTLSDQTREYRELSHPIAHKAGLSGLTRYRKTRGIIPPAPAVTKVTRKRKPVELEPVESAAPDIIAAAVETGRVVLVSVGAPDPGVPTGDAVDVAPAILAAVKSAAAVETRTRRDSRRALADALRAEGLSPAGDVWTDAKHAAGLS